MSLRVTIDVQGARRYLQAEKEFWERTGQEALQHFRTLGVSILQKNVPKGKTLELFNACTAEVIENTVRVYSAAPHAEIVDGEGKTAASPGRYVPAIDKRLVRPSFRNPKIGMHPGSRRTPFGRRTAEELRAEAEEWIRQKVVER